MPPPLVLLVAALSMLMLARLLPSLTVVLPGSAVLATLLAVIGLTVALAGVLAFKMARTTVNPMRVHTTSSLVTRGIYRVSRNPMYLGMLLVLTAWAVYLGNAFAALVLPVFVLYLNRFQIAPEERSMQTLFGDEFSAYCETTRRWL